MKVTIKVSTDEIRSAEQLLAKHKMTEVFRKLDILDTVGQRVLNAFIKRKRAREKKKKNVSLLVVCKLAHGGIIILTEDCPVCRPDDYCDIHGRLISILSNAIEKEEKKR